MKKIISLSLALTMSVLLFASCKGDNKGAAGASSNGESNASSTVTITSAADLDGLKIGCQSGTTGETWVLENCTKKEPKSYKTGMDAALDLKNGQIEAIIIDELPAKAIVAKNADLKILDIKFAKEEYAVAVKKGNTQLVETINATIKKMKDDGTYESLVNAFMPADGNIVIPEEVKGAGGGSLTMGTNAAFPPFEYVDGDKVVGFDISMAQHIALEARADLEVKDMAFDSLLAALQSGTIDMAIAGMSVTEKRKESVDFSEPYYESEQVIIVKA